MNKLLLGRILIYQRIFPKDSDTHLHKVWDKLTTHNTEISLTEKSNDENRTE
jgi:hypothetical protein